MARSGAAIGLAVPVVLQLLAKALDKHGSGAELGAVGVDYVQLMFWRRR